MPLVTSQTATHAGSHCKRLRPAKAGRGQAANPAACSEVTRFSTFCMLHATQWGLRVMLLARSSHRILSTSRCQDKCGAGQAMQPSQQHTVQWLCDQSNPGIPSNLKGNIGRYLFSQHRAWTQGPADNHSRQTARYLDARRRKPGCRCASKHGWWRDKCHSEASRCE